MFRISLIILAVTIDALVHGQRSSSINDNRDLRQQNLDQQIIRTIPKKLNLASFGIDVIKSTKSSNDDDDHENLKNFKTNNRESIHHSNRYRYDFRSGSYYPNNNNDNNNEMEWEYYDYRRRSSTRRSMRPSTTPSTTTTTTTTSTTTTTTTTRRPRIKINDNDYVLTKRDCQLECIPKHYLQHYYYKNCNSIFSRDCNCVKRFNCPDDLFKPKDIDNINDGGKSLRNDQNYCRLNNRQRYQIGETIPIPNQPCSVCRCRRDYYHSTKSRIDCSKIIDCPELAFGVRPTNSSCYFAYSHDRCCGIELCPDKLKWDDVRLKQCRYQNRTYRYGEQIYLYENHCKRCVCNEHWNEFDPESSNESCIDQQCLIDNYYQQNCLPIYQNDLCCPIDFVCPMQNNITIISTNSNNDYDNNNEYYYRKYFQNFDYLNDQTEPMAKSKYHCWFPDQNDRDHDQHKPYRLGDTILIAKNSTVNQISCARCSCKIPPMMTCVSDNNSNDCT